MSFIAFFLLLAATVETAPSHHALHVGSDNIPRASSIHAHHHHTNSTHEKHDDDPTEEVKQETPAADQSIAGSAHQMVKRSTDANFLVEKQNTVTIDWKSLMVTLSEIIHKILEFVSNTFKKLQERLLQAFVPFHPSVDRLGHPAVATSAYADWRSTATNLFNALVKFEHLRKNEVW
jgi:hypothetical protein